MSVNQFAAIARMRWQLARNRLRKAGKLNAILGLVGLIIAALGSLGVFVAALGWGRLILTRVEPQYMLFVWDVIAGVFLFAWMISVSYTHLTLPTTPYV